MKIDKARLAKLLQLSQSDNDHEALSAIRHANQMLSEDKLTWQNLLEVKDVEPTIAEMLMYCRKYAGPAQRTFTDSLEANYRQYNNLTEKQTASLTKTYEALKKWNDEMDIFKT